MTTFRKPELRRRVALFSATVAISLAFPALAAVIDSSWDGGAGSSLWSGANNWSPDGVPNNGTPANTYYNVTIGRGFTVNLDASRSIDSLTLSSGAGGVQTLNIDNSRILTIVRDASRPNSGVITLHGVLSLNSSGSGTYLYLNGNVDVTGSGVLQLGNNINNAITGVSGSRLTNNLTTIQGAGQIGGNVIAITNNANSYIFADFSGSSLILDPNAAGIVNQGTLAARNGGNLALSGNSGGGLNNTGGTISALDSSTVSIQSAMQVTGGTLSTTGTGVINVQQSSVLNGVTNTGMLRVPDAQTAILQGTITNAGTLQLSSTGSLADLRISGDVTLAGAGSITMSDNGNNRVFGNS